MLLETARDIFYIVLSVMDNCYFLLKYYLDISKSRILWLESIKKYLSENELSIAKIYAHCETFI